MQMKRVSFDQIGDLASGEYAARTGGQENGRQVERARRIALRIIREQLTEKQREYLTRYFFGGQTMTEIAGEMGVNKSTVSRTVARALNAVRQRMRYYDFRHF